ncbi:type II toxin-antitoxin system Phd/YefM family antitoxin [Roseiflexus sp.]|uniref:type II toxin-antitoxin system Phd/YefM family antitoxin n=1 Tax=Roseiflexus sp. TaxID=2562120 RepID=UPI00398A768E
MYRTVSATEARIRFGEIMRLTKQGPVIIEHGGKPEVVVMSKQQFDALMERTGSLTGARCLTRFMNSWSEN